MNRRALIITLVALGLSLAGIGILFYMQTFKTVTFNFKKDPLHVTVYKQDGDNRTEVGKLDKTGQLKLQASKYVVISDGSQYDPAGIAFEVKDKDQAIDVDPEYSSEYRDTIRSNELPAIQSVIKTAYPGVIDQFNFATGSIYGDGEWYATTLKQKTAPQDEPDIYRVVLKKENDKWVIKTKPALILSAKDYPDIPKKILSDINSR